MVKTFYTSQLWLTRVSLALVQRQQQSRDNASAKLCSRAALRKKGVMCIVPSEVTSATDWTESVAR